MSENNIGGISLEHPKYEVIKPPAHLAIFSYLGDVQGRRLPGLSL
jgi:hypothetical protein